MSLQAFFRQNFLFDKDKRDLFLTIVSSQVKSGRPYQDIFRPMLRSSNRYYRELAKKALNPTSPYFASHYAGIFPENTAKLLVLSQRFNAVPSFIDHSINNPDRKALSFLSVVILPNVMEIFLAIVFTVIFVALYLYNDLIAQTLVDLSNSLPYQIGSIIASNALFLGTTALLALCVYLYFLNTHSEYRKQLKKLGVYRFADAVHAINLFRVIAILTSGRSAEAVDVRMLFSELSIIFGDNQLHRYQFAVLRNEISKGSPIYQAIDHSQILDHESLELFKGLAPDESIPEISKASQAVADLLTAKTKVEIKFIGKNLMFFLLLYLGIAFVAFVQLSLGGGADLFSQSTGL